MLTDRQNTFSHRIQRLSLLGSSGSRQERGIMNQTKDKIQQGWDFKWTINSMNLSLKKMNENRPMSLEAKKLYDDLVAVYGEPDESLQLNKSTHQKIGEILTQTLSIQAMVV